MIAADALAKVDCGYIAGLNVAIKAVQVLANEQPWERETILAFQELVERLEAVRDKDVFAQPVWVPPLNEQRRIVAELDSLQREVDALKRLQIETAAELDALLPSVLDQAFKGEL